MSVLLFDTGIFDIQTFLSLLKVHVHVLASDHTKAQELRVLAGGEGVAVEGGGVGNKLLNRVLILTDSRL